MINNRLLSNLEYVARNHGICCYCAGADGDRLVLAMRKGETTKTVDYDRNADPQELIDAVHAAIEELDKEGDNG